MTFALELTVEALHLPTEKWEVSRWTAVVRAVSRKQALNKGLQLAQRSALYQTHTNDPAFRVDAEARFKEAA